MEKTRRDFIKKSLLTTGGLLMAPSVTGLFANEPKFAFKISLAEWSLNERIFGGEMSNLDFPKVARDEFGIEAVEYVNQFFADKAEDTQYLTDLKSRADDLGVQNVLIMVDNEGLVAAADDKERNTAVDNHKKWVDAAKFLGCHSIRINLFGSMDVEQDVAAWTSAAVDGLGKLAAYGEQQEIGVLVENHGGLSSHAGHLAEVLRQVNNTWAGTLPDFGNFCISHENNSRWGESCTQSYDPYKGVKELMPFAKGVSAKSYKFDENGNETSLDYMRLMKIVKESGFNNGYVGVEYEGSAHSPEEGIKATKRLLERIRKELA